VTPVTKARWRLGRLWLFLWRFALHDHAETRRNSQDGATSVPRRRENLRPLLINVFQLFDRLLRNAEVGSSSLLPSTSLRSLARSCAPARGASAGKPISLMIAGDGCPSKREARRRAFLSQNELRQVVRIRSVATRRSEGRQPEAARHSGLLPAVRTVNAPSDKSSARAPRSLTGEPAPSRRPSPGGRGSGCVRPSRDPDLTGHDRGRTDVCQRFVGSRAATCSKSTASSAANSGGAASPSLMLVGCFPHSQGPRPAPGTRR